MKLVIEVLRVKNMQLLLSKSQKLSNIYSCIEKLNFCQFYRSSHERFSIKKAVLKNVAIFL